MLRNAWLVGLTLLVVPALVPGCSAAEDEDEYEDEGALSWVEEGCTGAPTDSQRCDQGLFWYGKGNQGVQFRSGRANPNFNPEKPTLIYVHGWQGDAWKTQSREGFNYKQNDPESGIDVNTADAWIDAGWNVGLFYWTRLADDSGDGFFGAPDAAEAKIWRTDGPSGMRWRKNDGTFETVDVPTKPASELFFETFSAAMRNYRGPHVRIAGHSLGNQMATRLTHLVSKAVDAKRLPPAAMPKRLVLLDPYWTKNKKDAPRTGAARDVRDAIYMLARRGVAIEQYRTSSINDYSLGDDNPFVEENAAYTDLRPNYFGFWHWLPWNALRSDHRAAPNLYFWSFAFPPPSECGGRPGAGLSASATDETVRSFMGPGRFWKQGGGNDTPTPADDCVDLKTDAVNMLQPVGLFWERTATPGKLKVRLEAPPGAVGARYFVDGKRVGGTTRDQAGLGFELTLENLPVDQPQTLIVASVFDKDDKLIGTTEDMIDFVGGTGMYIRQFGGMNFEVGFDAPPAGLATVELDVDSTAITDDETKERRTARKAVRALYQRVDALERTFVLRGFDDAGREIASLERKFILR